MCRSRARQPGTDAEGKGVLFYGDNLDVLRTHVKSDSIDLIYLDPPFNSNAGYNVLFKDHGGAGADASIEAFDDTWTWGEAAQNALLDIAAGTNRPLTVMMEAMRTAIGENPLMAYLAMMAVRLVELHRVLKPTGSLYLHCDPTASHYLKLVLDAVIGKEGFTNEIIWQRTNAKSHAFTRFSSAHDVILAYRKGDVATWNPLYLRIQRSCSRPITPTSKKLPVDATPWAILSTQTKTGQI